MKKKKILYIHQYFRHPGEPGTSRSYWIARELISWGFDVTLITQKNAFNPEYKNAKQFSFENIDEIKVIFIKNAYSNDFSTTNKIFSFIKFMLFSTWFSLKENDVSLLIATSTPLSVGFPALILKAIRKTPFLFEIRDLWPEVPIQMGIIKSAFYIKFLRWFEKIIYQNSEHVIALSPGMAQGVINHIPARKVSVIPNMAKPEHFWPRGKNLDLTKQLGLSVKSFKVIHFGTMGLVNGLENFIEAAAFCKNNGITDIEFILAGSGKNKVHFIKKKNDLQLNNLHFFDRMPLAEISELVNLCDISYIGVSKFKILEINSANKFFDSLSAGKPIIINFGGWMQEIVEKEKCGLKVDPVKPEALVEKILFLKENVELRTQMGENGRRLAVEKFDKSILCGQFVDVVNNCLNDAK